MDISKKSAKKTNPIFIYSGILFLLVFLNILFTLLFQSEVNSYKLNQKEMTILDQDKRIIAASTEISEKYKDEIATISSIFPNEESFPVFIQTLEGEIRKVTDEYQLNFSSTPINEGDKLFLLFTITMKTDVSKLDTFLERLEEMQYLTHVTGITAKMPGGFVAKSEYSIGMKLYVQNPFNTK